MKFRLNLDFSEYLKVFLVDAGIPYLDRKYILQRFSNEGYPFLTKVLPTLAKNVLKALQIGHFCSPSDFSAVAWKGGLPKLLRGFLLEIFDRNGEVLCEPSALAIWQIRQVCEYLYKLALPYTSDTLDQFELSFLQDDAAVISAHQVEMSFLEKIRRNVESYSFPGVHEVLRQWRPRVGPGTFASNAKRKPTHYKQSIESCFVPEWARGISGYFKSYPAAGEHLNIRPDTSDVAELLFVPKDSRGPRVIIREPLKRLMVQMAYFDWFSLFLERNTHGRVNFQDQQVNRELARLGSITGKWSTLDLSSASDRVSYSVCEHLFQNVPVLRFFLKHRTPSVRLPSGKLHRMRKLSGMGSGLTFATMAFLIHTAIATALTPYYRNSFKEASKHVYVYGDDIIVESKYARIAANALSQVGLVVNDSKSFTRQVSPTFRESCGGDYFGGQDVGPTRLTLSSAQELKFLGTTLEIVGGAGLYQLDRHAHELMKIGFTKTVSYIYDQLSKVLGSLPYVKVDSPAIGRPYMFGDRYKPGKTGNYASIPLWVLRPVVRSHCSPNPYSFIGKKLSDRKEISPLEALFSTVTGIGGFTYVEPRDTVLRKRKICTINL